MVNLSAKGTTELTSPHGLSLWEFVPLQIFLDREKWTTTQLTQVSPVKVSRIDRVVLLELKNRRALTREIHQRMQEYEAALFKDTNKDTNDVEMAVFLSVTFRATGQLVNAVQVRPEQVNPGNHTGTTRQEFGATLIDDTPGQPDKRSTINLRQFAGDDHLVRGPPNMW